MNQPAAKVFLDEDVNVIIAKILHSHGYEVLTASAADRKSRSDPEQLEYAAHNGFTILTHNRRDFELLAVEYFDENRPHHGIIIAVRRPVGLIADRLLEIIGSCPADELRNQIIYI